MLKLQEISTQGKIQGCNRKHSGKNLKGHKISKKKFKKFQRLKMKSKIS